MQAIALFPDPAVPCAQNELVVDDFAPIHLSIFRKVLVRVPAMHEAPSLLVDRAGSTGFSVSLSIEFPSLL